MIYQWKDRTIELSDDLAFKKVLGSPDHSGLTLDLLNALMRQMRKDEFDRVKILNPFSLADFEGDKEIAVDVYAVADDRHEFQIEMQIQTTRNLHERFLDNWARLYTRQLKRGQTYTVHKPLMAIWFLKNGLKGNRKVIKILEAKDQNNKVPLDHFVQVLIDLGVFVRNLNQPEGSDKIEEGLKDWFDHLVTKNTLVMAEDTEYSDTGIWLEVNDIMKTLIQNDQAYYLKEARRRAREYREVDLQQEREEAKAAMLKGATQAMEKGKLEAKKEDAMAMRAEGIAVDVIARVTGLSEKQILAL